MNIIKEDSQSEYSLISAECDPGADKACDKAVAAACTAEGCATTEHGAYEQAKTNNSSSS